MRGKGRGSLFSMSSNTIFGITLVLALFAPWFIQWSSSEIYLGSTIWVLTLYPHGRWLFEITDGLPLSPLVALVRCAFAYQVKRYCEYKTRLVPTLMLGWIVECFVLEVYIVLAFLQVFIPLVLPTPLMVVVAWILMRRRSRMLDEQSWVEEEPTGAQGLKVTIAEVDDA